MNRGLRLPIFLIICFILSSCTGRVKKVLIIGIDGCRPDAMLTGVWHDKHGVVTNGYEHPNLLEYPHFFHLLKKQDSTIQTASLVTWNPINKILQPGDADLAMGYANDSLTTEGVVDHLFTADPDVVFV